MSGRRPDLLDRPVLLLGSIIGGCAVGVGLSVLVAALNVFAGPDNATAGGLLGLAGAYLGALAGWLAAVLVHRYQYGRPQ